ncbi:protein kinase domain-containing protein [Tundrisphaera sp. TA3]|uniref:serine/threonine-protein kinase n=1 Tax=Tundrisphaera sp. TA3 TaxID=3435775 RepID=UPI003EBFF37E
MAKQRGAWDGLTLAHGRYRVESLLGAGGMGFVYRARDANIDADVVIKVPRPEMLRDSDFAFRFRKEIQALVKLSHPHIVKISDAGEHDGLPFAIMQYLPGGSLDDRIEIGADGRMVPHPPGSLADWLPDVARALDFVHDRGYIHRDIKPGNILFDESGYAFLSDFGIVKAITAAAAPDPSRATTMTAAGGLVGTLEYMAYELVMDQPYDGRADQYALAVTVYEVLAGRRPFLEHKTALLVRIGRGEEAPALHDIAPVPSALSRAVHRALHPDRDRRYPSCAAFASAVLAEIAAAPPVPATATAPGPAHPPDGGPIPLACPNCGAAMAITGAMGGRTGRCLHCQARLRIAEDLTALELLDAPRPGTTVAEAPRVAFNPAAPPRHPTARKPRPSATEAAPAGEPPTPPANRLPLWIGAGVAATLGCVAGLAFLLAPSNSPTPQPPPRATKREAIPPPPPRPAAPPSSPIARIVAPPKPSLPAPPPQRQPEPEVATPIELAAIPPKVVIQGQAINVLVSPGPREIATPRLEYRLVGDRPPGMHVVQSSGNFVWVTGKDQEPGDYEVEVEARSAGRPARAGRVRFVIRVEEDPSRTPAVAARPPVGPGPAKPPAREPASRKAAPPPARVGPRTIWDDRIEKVAAKIATVPDPEARKSLEFATIGVKSTGSYGAVVRILDGLKKNAAPDPVMDECIAELRQIADEVRARSR